MNIETAIEIKGRTGEEFLDTDPDDIDEAERLSIEALYTVKRAREFNWNRWPGLLEGETKE